MRSSVTLPFVLLLGCSDQGSVADGGSNDAGFDGSAKSDTGSSTDGAPGDGASNKDGGSTLESKYPCDKGIEADPAFVWGENFEEGSVSSFTARYDQVDNVPGMSLPGDVPAKSCGAHSIALVSGGNVSATDFYKKLPAHDEWYVRWYAKYQAGAPWHHTGVWFGGYNPAQTYPAPVAGVKPAGNDRVEIAIEPVWGTGNPNPDFDFYNYWMNMHTCSSCSGSYWGNAVVSQNAFTADDNQWVCVEVHVKLNTDMASGSGAALEVWKNDALVQTFPETSGTGVWVQDHYCPAGANGAQCNYSPTAPGPLDLQFRTTTSLQLNYFWPQNYITDTKTGTVQYDDMVVATSRIGCLQ